MLLITNFTVGLKVREGGDKLTVFIVQCVMVSQYNHSGGRGREREGHTLSGGAGQRGTMGAFYTQLCGCHPSHRTFYRTDMLVQHVSCLLRLHILLGMEKYVWPNFHIICDSVGLITVLDSSCS